MGRLFIAEKPSVAAAIAESLGVTGKGRGYFICGEDEVSNCFGHLFEMPPPEYFNPAYKSWHFDQLPIIPPEWPVLPKEKTAERVELLGRMMQGASQIVNAGDPDNEGQLLVDQVIDHFNFKGPVLRYWCNAVDPDSIQKALNNMKDNRDYSGMRDAALARGRVDWLIGMNASRAFTLRSKSIGHGILVPVGRVLTPMLEMIDERCRRVENFRPIPYHFVLVKFQHANGVFSARWQPKPDQTGLDEEERLTNTDVANTLVTGLVDGVGVIAMHTITPTEVNHPHGLSLAGIGLLASEAFGFGAAQTLKICQSLYDTHKLTSYPRGDCDFMPESMHKNAAEVLAVVAENLPAIAAWVDIADPSLKSKIWNDKKITAHHAIVPTTMRADMARLTHEEQMVYQLIVRQYIAQFYPVHRYDDIKISVHACGEVFGARGKVITDMGWRQLFQDPANEDDDTQELPTMAEGDEVQVLGAQRHDKKTSAPKLFTEGTLPIAMGNIHNYVEDPVDKASLKEGEGIGTPATRAGIIEESKRRGFLTVKGKYIITTAIGRDVLFSVPPSVKSPVLTAKFQRQLKEIEQGQRTVTQFVEEQIEFVHSLIELAKQDVPVVNRIQCPSCEKGEFRRVARKDGSGHFWSCSEWRAGCKFSADDNNGQPLIGVPQERCT